MIPKNLVYEIFVFMLTLSIKEIEKCFELILKCNSQTIRSIDSWIFNIYQFISNIYIIII